MAIWSTEQSREQAELMDYSIFNPDTTADWTDEDKDPTLKLRKAWRWAGLDRYPTTCERAWETLIEGLEDNGVEPFFDSQPYDVQGLVLLASMIGYGKGKQDGRQERDE